MGFLFLDVSGGQHMIMHNNVLFSIKSRPFVEKQSRYRATVKPAVGAGTARAQALRWERP